MSESETQLTLQERIDEIVFQCFDQGVYWGELKQNEGGLAPDPPENPIDRTQAVKQLTTLFQQALTSLRDEVEKKKQTIIRGAGSADTSYVMGYNQAISECQRLLGDLK